MSRIYAVESCVFGAVSWAYLTVEQSLGVDAALNTWQLLSVAALSAVNLVGMGLVPAAPGGLELNSWVALDSQNKRTTVRLANQRYGIPIPANTFRWNDPRSTGRK